MKLMSRNEKGEARAYWFKELEGLDMLGAAWMRALNGEMSPEDIEHTVALLSPTPEHKDALKRWIPETQ